MNPYAVHTDQAPAALGPYSQAIVAGGFVFCSGTAGIDPRHRRDPGGDRGSDRTGPPQPQRHLGGSGDIHVQPCQDDHLLRERRRLRLTQRGLRPAHAHPATGPVGTSQRNSSPGTADLDRRNSQDPGRYLVAFRRRRSTAVQCKDFCATLLTAFGGLLSARLRTESADGCHRRLPQRAPANARDVAR
jgi:hypothetical protein